MVHNNNEISEVNKRTTPENQNHQSVNIRQDKEQTNKVKDCSNTWENPKRDWIMINTDVCLVEEAY